MGLKVIVCDMNPNCPGRGYADHYLNVSTADVEAVIQVALRYRADGISAYASDPAALTASIVAEMLGLPGNPHSVVRTLIRKDLFRNFLRNQGFSTPVGVVCDDQAEFERAVDRMGIHCLVKPVDSSGSRGVTLLRGTEDRFVAYQLALRESSVGKVIVEQVINRIGPQIAGDGFVADGDLIFACFGDENFDHRANPVAPVGESFPSSLNARAQQRVREELRRLIRTIGLRSGAINFDIVIGPGDSVYLLDIGPRNGGNGIPELLAANTGVDVLQLTILSALGESINSTSLNREGRTRRYHATYVVHSRVDGWLEGFNIHDSVKPCIKILHLFNEKLGQRVRRFTDSRDSLGYAVLEFHTEDHMRDMMPRLPDLMDVGVRHA